MATPNRTCSEEDCAKKHYARGYCRSHYENARVAGAFGTPKRCAVGDCNSAASYKGWCHKHYQRWKKWGDPEARDPKYTTRPCSVEDCEANSFCRGWCRTHYYKWYDHGDPMHRYAGEVRNGKRICAECGVDTPLSDMRRSLCAPCRSSRSKSAYSYEPTLEALACEVCENEYEGYAAKTKYCSDACRAVGLEATKTVRDRRVRQTTIERFSRIEIFDRDGWVCHLCGEGIPLVVKYPHPLSPSLDHVLPIALGGTHTRENSAASHLVCNCSKGARVTA